MAVLIPKIERSEPLAPNRSTPLNVNLPDPIAATAPLRSGVNAGIESAMGGYEEYQKVLKKKKLEAYDIRATDQANKLKIKTKNELVRIGQLKGDPTQAYEKFDQDYNAWEEEAFGEDDTDPEYRQILSEKLTRTRGDIYETRTIGQTKQYYSWKNDVINSAVKIRQDDAVQASEYLDMRNNASFDRMNKSIKEMYDFRVGQAYQDGLITEFDENGKPILSPQVESAIKSDMGDTIIPIVKSLNASGKANEAKKVINDYKQWLNGKDLASLTADNDEATVKNKALTLLDSLKSSSSVEGLAAIDASDAPADVKLKAKEILDTRDRINKNAQDRQVDQIMSAVYADVNARKDAALTNPSAIGNAYQSPADFRDRSALYKQYKDNPSMQDQWSKIYKILGNAPEETSPKNLKRYYDLVEGREQLDSKKMVEMRGLLADREFNALDSYFRTRNQTQTISTKQSVANYAHGMINDRLRDVTWEDGSPILERDRNGKAIYDEDYNTILAIAKSKYDQWSQNTPNITESMRNEKVNEISAQAVKDLKAQKDTMIGSFFRNLRNKFRGGSKPTTAPATSYNSTATSGSAETTASQTSTAQAAPATSAGPTGLPASGDIPGWTALYKKENPGITPTPAAIKAFRAKKQGN